MSGWDASVGALKVFIIAARPHGDNNGAFKRQDSVTKEIHVNSEEKKLLAFQFMTLSIRVSA